MKLLKKYRFYVNLFGQLKKNRPALFSEQETFHKDEVRMRTKTWFFQDMYLIRDIHDLKYNWHTVQVDNKQDNKQITEFDGWLANVFLKRLQKSL